MSVSILAVFAGFVSIKGVEPTPLSHEDDRVIDVFSGFQPIGR
jgi:hypothetical protein